MKITNIEVYDLAESIVASGFPMDTGKLRDSFEDEVGLLDFFLNTKNLSEKDLELAKIDIKPTIEGLKKITNHINRAIKLASVKSGSGHDCFLKGILVNYNIDYTQYWSMQCQRYHHIDFVSSSSKMLKLLESDLSNLESSCDISKESSDILRRKIDNYKKHKDSLAKEDQEILFMDILRHVPAGYQQHARMTTNYLQLKSIYFQRKNHKTSDWKYYCKWIETLPLFKELVINSK